MLLCIQTGKTMSDPNRMNVPRQSSFISRPRDEMMPLFGAKTSLKRSLEIAQRCQVKLDKVKDPFPEFEIPDGPHDRQLLRIRRAPGIRAAWDVLAARSPPAG